MGKPTHPRRLDEAEAMAVARNLRGSARKLNLVAQTIRGKSAEAALAALTFSKRRIAQDVKKVVQSAVANAENNHQLDVDRLVCLLRRVLAPLVGLPQGVTGWRPPEVRPSPPPWG